MIRFSRVLSMLLFVLIALSSACSDESALPPAKPLQVPLDQLAEQIPEIQPGPFAVENSDEFTLSDGESARQIRAVYPIILEGNTPIPIIVFSHGFASDIDQYDHLLKHWAGHGYFTVSVRHPDAGGTVRGIWSSLRLGKAGLIAARVADMQAVLEALASEQVAPPRFAGALDFSRIIAAGHSFGAFTAQQLGGALALRPNDDKEEPKSIIGRDSRIQAVVAVSPPGEMFGWIQQDSWKTMEIPMLTSTGTWDRDGRFVTDWRQHLLSFQNAPDTLSNQSLVIEGADHYLGNLICRRNRDEPPQWNALRILQAASLRFMNRQWDGAKGEAQNLDWQRATNGFATVTARVNE